MNKACDAQSSCDGQKHEESCNPKPPRPISSVSLLVVIDMVILAMLLPAIMCGGLFIMFNELRLYRLQRGARV